MIYIYMHIYLHTQIWDDYPHLVLPGTAVSRKMGFPEVIMPGR